MTLVEKLEREIKRLDWIVRREVARSSYPQQAADCRELLEEAVAALKKADGLDDAVKQLRDLLHDTEVSNRMKRRADEIMNEACKS